MSPRKHTGKTASSRSISKIRLILWALLILETAWLIAFIHGTGSLVPPGLLSRSSSAPRGSWDTNREAQLEDLQIQKILGEQGSRSDNTSQGK